MTKEAKIKKFKIAFLKPKAPDKETVKTKTALEKAVKTASKSGSKQDEARDQVGKLFDEIRKKDKAYFDELLDYKLTKHWDEPEELKVWVGKASQEEIEKYASKMLDNNPPEGLVSDCFVRLSRIDSVAKKCWAKAPDRLVADGLAYFEKTKKQPPGECAPFLSKVTLELFKKGKRDEIPPTMDIAVQPEDAREMAKIDPAGYAARFLNKAMPTTKLNLLKDPEVREAVSQDQATWDKLKEDAPVLGLLDSVKTKAKTKNLPKDQLAPETAKLVFSGLLADDSSLGLTYYTNKFTSPSEVMCTSKAKQKETIDRNRSVGDTETMPNQPAMQCDELVTVLKYVMEAALGPGSGVDCKHVVIKSMVLTKPINTLPGGLLKNTFGGNVYEDGASTPNKQVLFTGNDVGATPDAHTYLEVGGMKYDAVLGTQGDAVTDAVAEEFGNWDKEGYESKKYPGTAVWVAESKSSGNWVVKESDPKGALKAASNKNGFSTAYRLTAKLSDYATKKA
jgi:hypothetical protein